MSYTVHTVYGHISNESKLPPSATDAQVARLIPLLANPQSVTLEMVQTAIGDDNDLSEWVASGVTSGQHSLSPGLLAYVILRHEGNKRAHVPDTSPEWWIEQNERHAELVMEHAQDVVRHRVTTQCPELHAADESSESWFRWLFRWLYHVMALYVKAWCAWAGDVSTLVIDAGSAIRAELSAPAGDGAPAESDGGAPAEGGTRAAYEIRGEAMAASVLQYLAPFLRRIRGLCALVSLINWKRTRSLMGGLVVILLQTLVLLLLPLGVACIGSYIIDCICSFYLLCLRILSWYLSLYEGRTDSMSNQYHESGIGVNATSQGVNCRQWYFDLGSEFKEDGIVEEHFSRCQKCLGSPGHDIPPGKCVEFPCTETTDTYVLRLPPPKYDHYAVEAACGPFFVGNATHEACLPREVPCKNCQDQNRETEKPCIQWGYTANWKVELGGDGKCMSENATMVTRLTNELRQQCKANVTDRVAKERNQCDGKVATAKASVQLEVENLQKRNEEVNSTLRSTRATLNQSNIDLTAARTANLWLESSRAVCKKQLENATDAQAALQQQVELLEQQLESLTNTLSFTDAILYHSIIELEASNAAKRASDTSNSSCYTSLQSSADEKDSLSAHIEALETRADSAESCAEEVTEFKAEVAELKGSIDTHLDAIAAQKKTINFLENTQAKSCPKNDAVNETCHLKLEKCASERSHNDLGWRNEIVAHQVTHDKWVAACAGAAITGAGVLFTSAKVAAGVTVVAASAPATAVVCAGVAFAVGYGLFDNTAVQCTRSNLVSVSNVIAHNREYVAKSSATLV